jgi:hypothetical protein
LPENSEALRSVITARTLVAEVAGELVQLLAELTVVGQVAKELR